MTWESIRLHPPLIHVSVVATRWVAFVTAPLFVISLAPWLRDVSLALPEDLYILHCHFHDVLHLDITLAKFGCYSIELMSEI